LDRENVEIFGNKGDIFNTFAQDASLRYTANTEFYIDFEKREMCLAPRGQDTLFLKNS